MLRLLQITIALFISFSSSAGELAYVKTDTPRDTMETFINAMNDYKQGVAESSNTKKARIHDAIRCFSEKSTNVITSQREKELAAIFLKEVIDRVIKVDFSKIPTENLGNRWRLKNTEIVLKPEKEGEREAEWLITEGTWRRAGQFYQRVRSLPYIEGSGQGALYIQPWMEKYLPSWSKKETLRLKNWQWLGLLFGFLLGLFIRLLVYLGFNFYRSLGFSQKLEWQKNLLDQLEKPAALLSAALFWYAWMLYLKLEGIAFSFVNGVIQIIFGVAMTWAVYQCVNVLGAIMRDRASKTESTLDDQLIPFIEKALKLTIILLGILVVLQNMGVNVFSLLAGLGLGGLAFALAAKDTAANLFGSIMILVDRPFKIGDWVKVGDVEGTVEEIGFRSTRIRTFYSSLITVPNANMANEQIDNMGLRRYRRTRTQLDVAYDTTPDKMQTFIAGIREIIQANAITHHEGNHVYFNEYGASSLNVLLQFFLKTNDYGEELREKQAIFLEIFKLAEKLDVEFAYPTQTLYLKDNKLEPTV